jgi:hypothetical protein
LIERRVHPRHRNVQELQLRTLLDDVVADLAGWTDEVDDRTQ